MACLLKVVSTSSPSQAFGQHLAGFRIHNLGVEMIFEDVQPVLRFAFDGNAGPDDLRQSVDIVGADATRRFNAAAHGIGPRLGAENSGPQR